MGLKAEDKRKFIEFMLEAQALRFGDFITKSGRRTPYFINTANYRMGAQIAALGSFYASLVHEECSGAFDAMFGPAYKGIPLVTVTSAALAREHGIDKPFFFNRKEAKDHGEGGTLVGYQPKEGDRVIIIEDVITAGTAVRETVPLLTAAGAKAENMFISVDRCEVGRDGERTAVREVFETFGICVHALITVRDIYDYLNAHGEDPALLGAMRAYMDKYCRFDMSDAE